MNDANGQNPNPLLVMQIIAAALMAGVVMFGLVVVAVLGALGEPSSGTLISLVAAGFAVATLVIRPVVCGAMDASFRQQISGGETPTRDDLEKLTQGYQTRMIIGLALPEGAAMFNIVAVILEHNAWSLAVAGVLLATMAVQFPTAGKLKQWLEHQLTAAR